MLYIDFYNILIHTTANYFTYSMVLIWTMTCFVASLPFNTDNYLICNLQSN